MPDEIYNLGAQSHVKVSFELPEYTAMATGVASGGAWRVKFGCSSVEAILHPTSSIQ